MAKKDGCYGDVLTDDKAMEAFLEDKKDHFKVSCMMRKVKTKHMTKTGFQQFKKSLFEIDEDKPLKAYGL